MRPVQIACWLTLLFSQAASSAIAEERSPDPQVPRAASETAAAMLLENGDAATTQSPALLAADSQAVVAVVDGETIRLEDLLSAVRQRPAAWASFSAQWGRNAVLNQLIKTKLLTSAARGAFADDPDAQDLSDQQLRNRYQRRFLSPSTEVTEEELHAYYTQNEVRFGIPPMARIRELFFPKPALGVAGDPAADAWAVYEQLKAGASFEDFAAEHAPDQPSRQAGGDRGFLSLLERPQLEALLADLPIGGISEPFELTTGFSIVQLIEQRSGVVAAFDAVRDDVERALIADREGDLIADFLETQAGEQGVEILLPEYADAWPSLASQPNATETTD